MENELELNERIDVIATFGVGLHPCRPVKFRRPNGREVVVTKIGLIHPAIRGRRTVHVFSVTDGAADYRLEFDGERLTWHLTWMGDAM